MPSCNRTPTRPQSAVVPAPMPADFLEDAAERQIQRIRARVRVSDALANVLREHAFGTLDARGGRA